MNELERHLSIRRLARWMFKGPLSWRLVLAVAACRSSLFYIPVQCADNILPRAPIHTSFHPLGLEGNARTAAIGWNPGELLITIATVHQWEGSAAADVNVIHQSESGIYFVQRICSC
ncbi:hypothetical protein E2C01_007428 [Portunus trituberculatus]|uniref:Uncharacterized protein n=1 Tax=Portunus trituberculatus TaxID=210409 RepID=A0A5B7CZF3_PORTR|nr:hypothetical protein [Portunus trituberculatus]